MRFRPEQSGGARLCQTPGCEAVGRFASRQPPKPLAYKSGPRREISGKSGLEPEMKCPAKVENRLKRGPKD